MSDHITEDEGPRPDEMPATIAATLFAVYGAARGLSPEATQAAYIRATQDRKEKYPSETFYGGDNAGDVMRWFDALVDWRP